MRLDIGQKLKYNYLGVDLQSELEFHFGNVSLHCPYYRGETLILIWKTTPIAFKFCLRYITFSSTINKPYLD